MADQQLNPPAQSEEIEAMAKAIYERRYGMAWKDAFPSIRCSALNDALAAHRALRSLEARRPVPGVEGKP
ncbi:hypothetical protein [Roseomonas chloroacetimidivorans]|uniref:hypothetical protein n=1 Tax=Roseomonas chloroacetimidivorans TaxID=1766656 RepID=UPI003C74C3BE